MKCCRLSYVDFARACEQSTDFHFASLEHQFEMINECLINARDVRLRSKPATASDAESDKLSAMSSTSSASDDVRTLNCFTVVIFNFIFQICISLVFVSKKNFFKQFGL